MAFAPPVKALSKRGPARVKVVSDENAGRIGRAKSAVTTGPQRVPVAATTKGTVIAGVRRALGDITSNAQRKDVGKHGKSSSITENPLKRDRSGSDARTGPQRVAIAPSADRFTAPTLEKTNTRQQQPTRSSLEQLRKPALAAPAIVQHRHEEDEEDDRIGDMDLEDIETEEVPPASDLVMDNNNTTDAEGAVEIILAETDQLEEEEEEEEEEELVWPEVDSVTQATYDAQIAKVRESFVDPVDHDDPAMVSEYADEIFAYMERIETESMPNPDYVQGQSEITWDMRQTLVDWLLQVHMRYHMLPETLWIAINIVDRFLTKRVVSLIKLQLVGVTAMFIAAKYEEVLAPSVDEFVYMTDKGYTREEILKGERIILQTLDFRISPYCSPYSWVRRISKADDYDIQTRTLSKFLMEVTLVDHRFLRAKSSLIAAVGMYASRRMLGGEWDEPFIFYSNYTAAQLQTGLDYIVEKLTEPGFESQYVYKKYANKRFLKASIFARDWAIRAADARH
ncbi:cyclin [Auriculariales sp. MPI-PUGE-AT-0066]|nr:cyclin [Auriculariales sp. MPI-PUGE-AT-0066]